MAARHFVAMAMLNGIHRKFGWALGALALAIGCAGPPDQSVTYQRPVFDPSIYTNEPPVVEGYIQLGFDRLAGFPFKTYEHGPGWHHDNPRRPGSSAGRIPDAIKKLDGQKVSITGYMLPAKMSIKGLVVEFLLTRTPLPEVSGDTCFQPRCPRDLGSNFSLGATLQ